MKKYFPKKIKILISSLVALTFSFVSCGDDKPEQPAKKSAETKQFLKNLNSQGIKVTSEIASKATDCTSRDCLE